MSMKYGSTECEYVTTVTMMSSEGAKNVCRVVPHGLARSPKPPRQRKPSNLVKSVAFKAGNKLKRQRKARNAAKSVAFKAGNKLKRQRKPSNSPKSVAFKAGNKLKRQRKTRHSLKLVAFPRNCPCHKSKNPIKGGNQHAFR